MGRRKDTDAGERRTVVLSLKLTAKEKAKLQRRAAKALGAHPNLSEFARTILLGESREATTPIRNTKAIRELVVAITRVGTNLNQLTRIANERRQLPAERHLKTVTARIVATLERVLAL